MFSERFFTGWVSVGIAWLFFSSICVGVYPIWEGRSSIAHTSRCIWRDITGRRTQTVAGAEVPVGGMGSGSEEGSVTEKVVLKS